MKNVPSIRIESYFALDVDLAAHFREWPEFVSGSGYQVELQSEAGETVSISQQRENETGNAFVLLTASGETRLFQRALGLVVSLLLAGSDQLVIHRSGLI